MLSDEYKMSALISTLRHGEKNTNGELTEAGEKQAILRGIKTKHLEGDITIFHSGVDRVKQSARMAGKYLRINDQQNVDIEKVFQDHHLQDYVCPELHYLFNPKNKGIYFEGWDDTKLSPDERIQKFLDQKDYSSEPEIYPSPKQMAQRLGNVLLTEVNFSGLTDYNFRTNFINGTHEPVVMSFLYYALNNFLANSEKFVEEVGGSIDYSEGFDLEVYQNPDQDLKVFLRFRDIYQELNLKDLEEFLR
jgi:hypothetical protein